MTHPARRSRPFRRCAAALLALLTGLAACQTRPQMAYDAANPRTAAVRNIGNFN